MIQAVAISWLPFALLRDTSEYQERHTHPYLVMDHIAITSYISLDL